MEAEKVEARGGDRGLHGVFGGGGQPIDGRYSTDLAIDNSSRPHVDAEGLSREESITWLYSPEGARQLLYVRESSWFTNSRRRPFRLQTPKIIVAYSVLRRDAKHDRGSPGWFTRRIFWLKLSDAMVDPWSPYGADNHPAEAVAPASITAGRPAVPTAPRTHRRAVV